MSQPAERLTAGDLGLRAGPGLGRTATLVQLSSGFCAPCRAARHVLEHVAAESPGVVHVDIDVAHDAALAHRLAVSRTPTVVVLGPDGTVLVRYERVPRLAEIRSVVARSAG